MAATTPRIGLQTQPPFALLFHRRQKGKTAAYTHHWMPGAPNMLLLLDIWLALELPSSSCGTTGTILPLLHVCFTIWCPNNLIVFPLIGIRLEGVRMTAALDQCSLNNISYSPFNLGQIFGGCK